MGYLKIIGGILLVCCGTLSGLYAAGRYRRRVELTEQYWKFLTQAETILRCTPVPLQELLRYVRCGMLMAPIAGRVRRLLREGDPPESAWRKAVDASVPHPEDRKLFYEFGDHFGTGDLEGELRKLALHCQFVQQHYEELKEELSVRKKLYRILGLFGGVMAAVLLI